ncbi:hypothetical protein GL2_40600 [Microbulbifer sp. GL-2]|nr:hypothetical protein GL2_40600 [Microbulbifer sp. GL-2]
MWGTCSRKAYKYLHILKINYSDLNHSFHQAERGGKYADDVETQHIRGAGRRQICSCELDPKSAYPAQGLMNEVFGVAEKYAYHSHPGRAPPYS